MNQEAADICFEDITTADYFPGINDPAECIEENGILYMRSTAINWSFFYNYIKDTAVAERIDDNNIKVNVYAYQKNMYDGHYYTFELTYLYDNWVFNDAADTTYSNL